MMRLVQQKQPADILNSIQAPDNVGPARAVGAAYQLATISDSAGGADSAAQVLSQRVGPVRSEGQHEPLRVLADRIVVCRQQQGGRTAVLRVNSREHRCHDYGPKAQRIVVSVQEALKGQRARNTRAPFTRGPSARKPCLAYSASAGAAAASTCSLASPTLLCAGLSTGSEWSGEALFLCVRRGRSAVFQRAAHRSQMIEAGPEERSRHAVAAGAGRNR